LGKTCTVAFSHKFAPYIFRKAHESIDSKTCLQGVFQNFHIRHDPDVSASRRQQLKPKTNVMYHVVYRAVT